jgi:putative redox protein
MTVTTVQAISSNTPYRVTLKSGSSRTWISDEPEALGGGDEGPSPTQLLLSSLGACTIITLQMYAHRKEWPLTGVEITLQLNPAGNPEAGHTEISRRITVQGNLSSEQQVRLLQIAKACPIHKVLSGEITIDSSLKSKGSE